MNRICAGIAAAVFLAIAPTAAATSEGANGRIAAGYSFDDSAPCGDMGGHICSGDSFTALRVIGPAGRGTRTVFRCEECNFGRASWSPDGRRIAFADANGSIYVARADGRAKRTLRGARGGTDPTWSPGGEWIAFVSRDGLLRRVPARGGRSRPISRRGSGSNARDSAPSWCPTGRIVFSRATQAFPQIFSIRANGRGLRQLTGDAMTPGDCGANGRVLYSSATTTYLGRADSDSRRTLFDRRLNEAVLSPDGRAIAYAESGDVWTVRIDGTAARPVTNGGDKDFWSWPAWQPLRRR